MVMSFAKVQCGAATMLEGCCRSPSSSVVDANIAFYGGCCQVAPSTPAMARAMVCFTLDGARPLSRLTGRCLSPKHCLIDVSSDGSDRFLGGPFDATRNDAYELPPFEPRCSAMR